MGASAGAGVIVSQFYGAGDENGVQRSAHTALMLALILGIVLTIAGIVFSPAILRWMRTPEEVMNQSVLW
jgi:Na+-driven multidrug efflux pump